MRLDIGCGKSLEPGWEGIDIYDFGQKYKHDLLITPWPIADNSCEEVKAFNVLEHFTRAFAITFFNELWRITRPNGVVKIITPNAVKNMELAMADITHKSLWVKKTFQYYLTKERPRYADYRDLKQWRILKLEDYEPEPDDIYAEMTPVTLGRTKKI